MFAYILLLAAIGALSVSLYKDRRIEQPEPNVIRALRFHHFAQLVLVVLAFANTLEGERTAQNHRDTILARDLRDKALSLKAEFQRYTTVTYTLSKAKNFKNAAAKESPFGMYLPNNAVDRLRERMATLTSDIEKGVGSKAPEITFARDISSLLNGGIGLVSFGSSAFVNELNSAETAAEQAAVFARHPCERPRSQDAAKEDLLVAPGGRAYFLAHVERMFSGLDAIIDHLNRRAQAT